MIVCRVERMVIPRVVSATTSPYQRCIHPNVTHLHRVTETLILQGVVQPMQMPFRRTKIRMKCPRPFVNHVRQRRDRYWNQEAVVNVFQDIACANPCLATAIVHHQCKYVYDVCVFRLFQLISFSPDCGIGEKLSIGSGKLIFWKIVCTIWKLIINCKSSAASLYSFFF